MIIFKAINRNLFVSARTEAYLFVFISLCGLLSSFLLYPLAVGYPYQFGKQMIGLFIPPFLSTLYLFYCAFTNKLSGFVFFRTILLFFIQLIPFFPLLVKIIAPYPKEDFERLLLYANNMISNHTLWGGDLLAFPLTYSNAYITQPGYRYFVAFEQILFGNLYRFVSVFNIALFLGVIFIYYKVVCIYIRNRSLQLLLLSLVLLSVPYAVKNILMGLSEWFTIALLVLACFFYCRKKDSLIAIALLALVPFLRQNLLPPVLLLTLFVIINNSNRVKAAILFTGILLLPVYHNLYYAGEFRFFVSVFHWPFIKYDPATYYSQFHKPEGLEYKLIVNNLLHYFGFHIKPNNKLEFLKESFLFLILFNFAYLYVIKKHLTGLNKLSFMCISLSTMIPTVFFATDFYPRFEFVNIFLVMITIPIILSTKFQYKKTYRNMPTNDSNTIAFK
jgi:hypothetical protein